MDGAGECQGDGRVQRRWDLPGGWDYGVVGKGVRALGVCGRDGRLERGGISLSNVQDLDDGKGREMTYSDDGGGQNGETS